MPDHPRAFVIPPDGGTVLRGPVGGPMIIKADGATTGGSFTFIELVIPAKEGPPLHVHRAEDEMWYILDGTFRFRADERLLTAPTGSFVFVPRGTRHCFQNVEDAPARILVMFTPAGMERFFEAHAALPHGPVDPELYRRIAASAEMDVAGPPLAMSDPL